MNLMWLSRGNTKDCNVAARCPRRCEPCSYLSIAIGGSCSDIGPRKLGHQWWNQLKDVKMRNSISADRWHKEAAFALVLIQSVLDSKIALPQLSTAKGCFFIYSCRVCHGICGSGYIQHAAESLKGKRAFATIERIVVWKSRSWKFIYGCKLLNPWKWMV